MARIGRRAPLLGLFGTLVSATAGCSLMGWDDLEIGQCTQDSQCEPINESHGILPFDCARYVCRSDRTGCELRLTDADGDGALSAVCEGHAGTEGPFDCDDSNANSAPTKPESCDGKDNNCDGIIDEGLTNAPGESTATGLGSGGALIVAGGVTVRRGEPVPLSLVVSKDEAAYAGVAQGLNGVTFEQLYYQYQLEQDEVDVLGALGDSGTCPVGTGNLNTCNFAEAAGVWLSSGWLMASISTEGCAAGEVRLGYRDGDTGGFIQRGPEQHSNVYAGVTPVGRCTGAHRTDGTLGAARLSMDGYVPTDKSPQALVVWLATPQSREQCGGDAVDVEALGLWLETATARTGLSWASATGSGIPQTLGRTQGGGAVALRAVNESVHGVTAAPEGYLVAFGDDAGGVTLRWLDALAEPPAYELTYPANETLRELPPLVLGASGNIDVSAPVDHVGLALVSVTEEELTFGVAWVEGCGEADASVVLARGRYAFTTGTFDFDAPVTLTTVSGLAAAPRLAYEPSGFLAPDSALSDNLTTANLTMAIDGTGGFLVLWNSDDVLQGARVLDETGQLLEEPTLEPGIGAPSAVALSGGPRGVILQQYVLDTGKVAPSMVLCGDSNWVEESP